MVSENTDGNGRSVRLLERENTPPEQQAEAAKQAALKAMWAAVPGWLRVLGAVGLFGSGGALVDSLMPYSVTPAWETKTEAKTEHDAIRADVKADIEALKAEMRALPAQTADAVVERLKPQRGRR